MKEITILFVDDEQSVLNSLKRCLIKEPYQKLFARSGQDALEAMAKVPVQVIVSDMKMPQMDGLALLEQVKKKYPETIRLVLSGFSEVEQIIPAINTGEIYRYISKPLEPLAFKTTLNSAIDFYLLKLDRKQLVKKLKIINQDLLKALNKKEKAEQALEKARLRARKLDSHIQERLLCGQIPKHIKGASIAAFNLSAEHLAGDFYEIIEFAPNRFDILIGDVMGKGTHAALIGAGTKQHFLRVLGQGKEPSPSALVQMVHDQITQSLMELESFVTISYARFDLEHQKLDFIDCGHPPLLHYQALEGSCRFHQGINTPLGFIKEEQIVGNCLDLLPGDIIVFYSDGITEAKSPEGQMFGPESLARFIEKYHTLEPGMMIKKLEEQIKRFVNHKESGSKRIEPKRSSSEKLQPQKILPQKIQDDSTCLIVKLNGAKPNEKNNTLGD